MTRILFAAIAALALAPATPGFAQDTPEPSPSPAVGPVTESPAEPERETPPPARDESPYDYQASEEISEDLSVSFPVDI